MSRDDTRGGTPADAPRGVSFSHFDGLSRRVDRLEERMDAVEHRSRSNEELLTVSTEGRKSVYEMFRVITAKIEEVARDRAGRKDVFIQILILLGVIATAIIQAWVLYVTSN